MSTLDELWQSLGLDSLPGDAGTAVDLNQTRLRDWEEVTVRSGEHSVPEEERADFPTLSLAPPATTATDVSRELVVTGLLGEGGMGRVLLARQASLGRDVAVKVPRRNASAGAINALVHEAQTSGGLEHPGIVPVYSLGSDTDGRPALIMKRVDGVSWSMLVRTPHDPAWQRIEGASGDRLDANIEILRQVCNAIAFAHSRGVLHRDVKLSNVLIGEYGEVYVADWGIAIKKLVGPVGRTAALVGSPVYLAPEMVTGDDARMDERTDVFLLGAALYELLSGTPPWSGPDLRAVLEAALACTPRPFAASVPGELADICRKAMAKDPSQRFQTALAFRDALGGYLRHRGSVQLARAAEARLGTLLATLQSTAKDGVYPLLSECRFGFAQALKEWPENEQARTGLTRCLEATASYELSEGRLDAARVLLAELPTMSAELSAQLAAAEGEERKRTQSRLRHEQLSHEHDPAVALRQRVQAFLVTTVGVSVTLLFPVLFPELHLSLRLDRWYLTYLMSGISAAFFVALWVLRRQILATRVNRRIMGMVTIALLGTLFQRMVCALQGLPVRETIFQNSVLVAVVCVTGGITLHSGFYWSAASVLLGLIANLFITGHEPQLFGVSAILSLGVAALSWKSWGREHES